MSGPMTSLVTPSKITAASVPSDQSNREAWDGFISYASSDRAAALRIQRFLEQYRRGGKRLRIFLDRTDIRGGVLSNELRDQLARSRRLIVCVSPAAVESKWVSREIEMYCASHSGAGGISIAVVVLREAGSIIAPEGIEPRNHDLRRAWWFGVARPRARLELLRLLAFVTDIDLRSLRNWHIRRLARNLTLGALMAIGLIFAVLSLPVTGWDPIEVRQAGQTVPLIAAEADGSRKLWIAARFRAPGPQGFRNYIRSFPDASDASNSSFGPPYNLSRRLLPRDLIPSGRAQSAPTLSAAWAGGRSFVRRS
jgi:TIR domain